MVHLRATPFVPGHARGPVSVDPEKVTAASILVLPQHQLTDLAARPAGLVVVGGAPLSHSLIRVIGLGIPTVIASGDQAQHLRSRREIVIDGATGLVTDPEEMPARVAPTPAAPRAGLAVHTSDGAPVWLRASVADAAGAARASAAGAAGLGLVRSEFLAAAQTRPPDADYYEGALLELCETAHPLPVTVRLPDVTADKRPAWLAPLDAMRSPLGLQGCRLYGIEPVRSAFRAVVAAVGRLTRRFELSLLVPYVTRPEEFLRWRAEIHARLPAPLAVGCMAETPAAVLDVRALLEIADFVSIGCNDLLQCLFGADRDLPEVAALLDPYAPVIFRLLRQVAQVAEDRVAEIQLCGLLPQLPGVLPLLLGLGYRVFSVEPVFIPYLAATVRQTDTDHSGRIAAGVCAESDADSVRMLVGVPRASTWALGAHMLPSKPGA